MISTRLSGTDWLDAQRVPYETIPFSDDAPLASAAERLKCNPSQIMAVELFVNEKDAVIVVRPFSQRTDISLVEKHVGLKGLRPAVGNESVVRTGLPIEKLHPFLENYVWKVLDESIFQNEFVYIRAGRANEIVKVEANALKYVIGVVNGLLAEVTVE